MANPWVDKGPAKTTDDVVVFARDPSYRKPIAVVNKKMQEGRRIHQVIKKQGKATIKQICQTSGYTVERVIEHVNYEVDKGRLKVEKATRQRGVVPDQDLSGELPADRYLRVVSSQGMAISKSGSAPMMSDEPTPPAPEAIDLVPPSPERVSTTVHRIIRDTELARRVKALHRFKCQICRHTIELGDNKFYAEAHHIQPLGQPHNGPDEIGNILCLCPNHHAELDYGVSRITLSSLATADGHAVAPRFVMYHNERIYPHH